MSLSTKEIEEYGKIVQYNPYTGEFRDVFRTNEFEYPLINLLDLLENARYYNCKCQCELTLESMGQSNRHSDTMLNKKIDNVDKRDMFYYLTGNFLQHNEKEDSDILCELEGLYRNGSSSKLSIPGSYNFGKGTEFDFLLENLVTKSPCFRRYLANRSSGWTMLRVLELCFAFRATDVNYNFMIVQFIATSFEYTPRLDLIVEQLKTWPNYRINCLPEHHLTIDAFGSPFTIGSAIPYVERISSIGCGHFLVNFLGPRFVYMKMSWQCKKIFLIAKYKPNRDCPLSTTPTDILKHILHFVENFSLPKAVSFEFTQEVRNKIQESRSLSNKIKNLFYKK